MHEYQMINLEEKGLNSEECKKRIAALCEKYEAKVGAEEIDYYNLQPRKNTGKHFSNLNDAKEFLYQEYDKNPYCSPYCTYDFKRSAKYVKLQERVAAEQKKLETYKKEHSVSNFKAAFVGCEACASKINRKYIKKDECPVCGNDLRSATTVKTIALYQNNLLKLKDELKEESKKMRDGKKGKYDTKGTLLLQVADTHS